MATNKKKNDTTKTRRIWALVLTVLLFAGSLLIAFPPQDKINQGLDIQGGLSVVLSAKTEGDQTITLEDMEKAKSIIETRVNALGASEASVQIQGDNQILVQIPGLSDSSQALATIGKTGVLEFARLDSFTDSTVQSNIESGNIIDYTSVDLPEGEAPTGAISGLADYSDAKHITVESGTYEPLFTGEHITQVTVGKESDTSANYAVNIRLDSEATAAFAQASQDLVATNGKIVILLDGEVNSAPAVQSAITTGEVQITGNYTLEEAKALQTVLDSGSLPVSFAYEQSTTVGPTLGQGELSAGIMSMILGIVIVMLYLLVFYRGFGLIPAANMIVFFVIYMGVLGTLSALGLFSLSLAGIAGIILSIGMTADSVILAIERFKEELKEGKTIKSASEKGVHHAIITSIDADVVSLISALALFFLATSSIKGFGLTLTLGILCDICVMLLFVSPLIRLLAPKCMKYYPAFWGIAYAQELGDVRTGAEHYMLPEQVAEKKEEDKEKERARKEREKASKKSTKERNKAADKRARELKREQKKRAKLDKKEKLEKLREMDAERDEARRESKKAQRDAKRAKKRAEKATDAEESTEAKDKVENTEEAREEYADALDRKAQVDDKFESFVEKVTDAREKEETAEAAEKEMLDDMAASKADDVEVTDANETADTDVAVTVKVNEKAADAEVVDAEEAIADSGADADSIEARSADEIADVISSITGSEVEDTTLVREVDVDADMVESGPNVDADYGVKEEADAVDPQPYMNRAARRAAGKKNKKN